MIEALKEFLGDELYAQVTAKLKGHEDKVNLVNLADGGYVSKSKFDAETEKANTYKSQLEETKTQLGTLKQAAGNHEELSKKVSELQTKYDTDTAALNARLAAQDLDFSLSEKLRDASLGVRNPKTMMRLLDKAKLKKDGEDILGLKEQLELLKKDDATLFLSEDDGAGKGTGGAPFSPVTPASGGGNNPFSFDFVGVRAKPGENK